MWVNLFRLFSLPAQGSELIFSQGIEEPNSSINGFIAAVFLQHEGMQPNTTYVRDYLVSLTLVQSSLKAKYVI